MIHIHAIDDMCGYILISEETGDIKEAQWFGPEVIGCKVVDPWINKYDG
jgi:hypothetical protein